MRLPRTPVIVVLAVTTMLVGVVGCGGAPQAPPSPAPPSVFVDPALPPRPVELRLDGLDPCALLTEAQLSEFGMNPGSPTGSDYGAPLQGPMCLWSNYPAHPDNGLTGSAVLNHGAEYGLGYHEPLRSIDGFAATTTTSRGSDPNYFCAVLVDVAPGQALAASYTNNRRDYPGMNRKLACDKAMKLAAAMLATLRAIKDK